MIAAPIASPPERPRPSCPDSSKGRSAGLRNWMLTLVAFRELVPVQSVIQAVGIMVITASLLALTLFGRTIENVNLGLYAQCAFNVAVYACFTHGIVMGARPPMLLRAGLTRGAVMTWLTCTGMLLGAASTALCGLLTIPDVVLDRWIEGINFVVVPQLAVLVAPVVTLSYLVGACTALLFQRRPWWVGVIAILVSLNIMATCVGCIVTQWGTPWGAVWIILATALVVAAAPLGTWLLLRRYEP